MSCFILFSSATGAAVELKNSNYISIQMNEHLGITDLI